MNPEALGRGANQFTQRGAEVGEHAATVADVLASLGPAFRGAGQLVWPAVAEQMAGIERLLAGAQGQITNTGGGLGALAQSSTAVDQDGGASMGTGPT